MPVKGKYDLKGHPEAANSLLRLTLGMAYPAENVVIPADSKLLVLSGGEIGRVARGLIHSVKLIVVMEQ